MEKQYTPAETEARLYKEWLAKDLFTVDETSKKDSYSIVIPPPNVTGILHMGHALNNTIQDILIRWRRMCGYEALWVPGTDHAGIATQNVVERKLAEEGSSRHELGREAFVGKVWEWKKLYHETITTQLKKLGSSCDWSRERFTMDEGLSRAVRRVFVQLYKEGLIYRGKYIINWCPRCHTALSDEEAEHHPVKGRLWYFRYPLKDGSGYMTVATTRPETMLGDTAVAVNPADQRYKKLIGKMLVLPLAEREIPVIADDFVDREFGTGAVKVTPAHDPNDFQMGLRHRMTPLVVMDEAGVMCGPVPDSYKGLDRFECRKRVVADMESAGLCEKVEDHDHAVGHCYRCHTVVEPYYSDQWFVKMKPLAEPALKAALEDDINFYPQRWRRTYIEWMENIRDWCISRQIWWGHRIPVWYCEGCGELTVEEEDPAACPKCHSTKLRQDEDVLDTWFSSWLWPFSTMGWPEETAQMRGFYPTDTLVTAPEILFFWVARMIMAGLHFTGELPFSDVVLHGTVRDSSGRKMSKSLGNSIDPLDVIESHGADALRFSLIMITAQGADVFLGNDTFDIGRNFANKLWNASRFLLGTIEKKQIVKDLPAVSELRAEDRWILSRLNAVIHTMNDAIGAYRFNEAAHCMYDFTWHDFCDWYIEIKKGDLYQDEDPRRRTSALAVSGYVLASILKLLHPIMPFLTSEIWKHVREKIEYAAVLDHPEIVKAAYPKPVDRFVDPVTEDNFELLKEVVTSLRTIRAENNVPPDKKGSALIIPVGEEEERWLSGQVPTINIFARLEKTDVSRSLEKPKFSGQAVVRGNEVYLELEGLIDREVEIARITREIERTEGLVEGSRKRLENESFISRAPADVVEKEKQKLAGLKSNLQKLRRSLDALQG